MLAQTVLTPHTVTTPELGAVKALLSEDESPVSDAPLYRPEAVGLLLLALLLSPKGPKEKK
ncbi:hypothetical protein ACIQF6_23560 [Kitasatospora sp. NPDC092948]|uniref:hypothetical protein n=1 Tax=Kitasatospora sp. NPDC092948 TaxID=3364088 RepID=UPI0037F7E24A